MSSANRLKRSDRCDACGAQAKVEACFFTGALLFCQHHFNKHRNEIHRQAMYVKSFGELDDPF